MRKIHYSDFDPLQCKGAILDFKLYDIPSTMRRNVKRCAELGAAAVTVADHPLNCMGITAAREAGKEYGIQIIVAGIDEPV